MKLFEKLDFTKKDCQRYEALFINEFKVKHQLTLEICSGVHQREKCKCQSE